MLFAFSLLWFWVISTYTEYNQQKIFLRNKNHWNRSETTPNAIKPQVIKKTGQVTRFPLFWTILYDHHIRIQTLTITLLRNILLTVPKGACSRLCMVSIDISMQVLSHYFFQVQDQSAEVINLYPQALGLYGTWLAESKSENPNTIIEKYLEKVSKRR